MVTLIHRKPGFEQYLIESEFQRGGNLVTVFTPDVWSPGTRYPVVYMLPVEAGADEGGGRWGAALRAADGLAEQYQAICVIPSFDTLPWYGDNGTAPTIRHESYLMRIVLPFVASHYPTLEKPAGRLLLGFSKSGWGAVSLLLRHPDAFGQAAAWDAPLMLEWTDAMGVAAHFGDEASFARCHIPTLLGRHAEELRGFKQSRSFMAGQPADPSPPPPRGHPALPEQERGGRCSLPSKTGLFQNTLRIKQATLRGAPRLILTGYGNFRDDLHGATRLLESLGIPFILRDGPRREHHWESGWVAEAMGLLMESSST